MTQTEADSLVVSAADANFEDLWSPFPTGIAPSGAFCASLDSYRCHLGVDDGPFELTARAWAVAGTVE